MAGHVRGGTGAGQWDAAWEPLQRGRLYPPALARENPKLISVWACGFVSAITMCLVRRVRLIQS